MSQIPPKPKFLQADETSIVIEWDVDRSIPNYQLSWKQYPQPWTMAQSRIIITPDDSTKIKEEIQGLDPATSYCIRLSSDKGDIGPELIVDTNAIGCTPETKSCCVIL